MAQWIDLIRPTGPSFLQIKNNSVFIVFNEDTEILQFLE